MKGKAIAGLILGILACVLSCIGTYGIALFALPCAIVGLVLSVKAGKELKAAGQGSGLATAALVLSIIGLVVAATLGLACGICGLCATCTACAAKEGAEAIVNGAAGLY